MKLDNLNSSIEISEIGSFFAGHRIATLRNQPKRMIEVARNAPERMVDLNGDYVTGQCYVQFVKLAQAQYTAPVMFWHGGAMTGVTWESTPDGRPGWQDRFLKSGFDTYICDAMERGRSGWSPYPEIYNSAPFFRTQNEAWSLFRLGNVTGYDTNPSKRQHFEGLQFPVDTFDEFGAQFVPRWSNHSEQTLEAYFQVLDVVGPVWLIAHSQGGNFALDAVARHPEYFHGVVVIEPASAPKNIGSAAEIPHLFLWGDYIDRSPLWISYKSVVDDYVKMLETGNGLVEIMDLPERGIRGNSHVPMMDKNSAEIASLVVNWIDRISTSNAIARGKNQS